MRSGDREISKNPYSFSFKTLLILEFSTCKLHTYSKNTAVCNTQKSPICAEVFGHCGVAACVMQRANRGSAAKLQRSLVMWHQQGPPQTPGIHYAFDF